MQKKFEILNGDGSVNQEMSKDIPEYATDMNGAVEVFLSKRNALKEVATPDETEAKFINEATNEELWLVTVQGAQE